MASDGVKAATPSRSSAWPFPRMSHRTGLYLITGVCGLVDAACFLSLGGVFAEIMTGNLLFLCFYVGTGEALTEASKYVLVIAAFAVGAVIGGRLHRGRLEQSRCGFVIEWVLLVLALIAAAAFDPGPAGIARDIVVSLLGLAMGIQNALIRKHGVPDLATNVMTLTIAGLIAETRLGGGRNDHWERRLSSVAIFIVSATVGAVLTTRLGSWAPLTLSVALFTIALFGLMVPDK